MTLKTKKYNPLGYITYVFEIVDYEDKSTYGTKYVMCTQFPNWDHRDIDINETGYVTLNIIEAGKDKWYNGATHIPYKYNNIQFVSFIDKFVNNIDKEFKL